MGTVATCRHAQADLRRHYVKVKNHLEEDTTEFWPPVETMPRFDSGTYDNYDSDDTKSSHSSQSAYAATDRISQDIYNICREIIPRFDQTHDDVRQIVLEESQRYHEASPKTASRRFTPRYPNVPKNFFILPVVFEYGRDVDKDQPSAPSAADLQFQQDLEMVCHTYYNEGENDDSWMELLDDII